MARRDSAARRYAEAAFEVATRDDAIEAWRAELDAAAARIGEERVTRVLSNPAIPLDQRSVALAGLLQGTASSGPDRRAATRRGRVPPP
jgi:F0F1-type ATP synthase delta subunit